MIEYAFRSRDWLRSKAKKLQRDGKLAHKKFKLRSNMFLFPLFASFQFSLVDITNRMSEIDFPYHIPI